jgi:PAS domain S-box-containing protein
MSRGRFAVLCSALALGVAGIVLISVSDHLGDGLPAAIASLVIGWLLVAAGLVAWSRRPDTRFGTLMVVSGFVWLVALLQFANGSVAYTIGLWLAGVPLATFAHLLLAFPNGRLSGAGERAVVGAAYATTIPLQLVVTLVADPATSSIDCPECPANAFLVSANDSLANGLILAQNAIGVVIVLAIVAILRRRWIDATAPARRALGPVFLTGSAVLVFGIALFVTALAGWDGATPWCRLALYVAMALVPLAFVAGLLQLRLASLGVIRLIVELNRGQARGRLRDSIARALGDPSLVLGYWLSERQGYVDMYGRSLVLPVEGSGRSATVVEHDGERIAVLIHDASLDDRPELLDAVRSAASLALVNERLQAEVRAKLDELRTSEGRLRALIDASPLAIIEVDLDDRVTLWNRAAERLFGWTREEVLGGPLPVIPPGWEGQRGELRARLLAGETFADLETVRTRKDGVPLDVSISAAPVRGADGRVVGAMAEVADVSERKRAQEELRRERDFISAVLDTASTLVIVTDREGRFVRFNQACERLTGYTFEEVKGKPFWDLFIDPKEAPQVRAAVEKVWAGVFPSENENHWILRDGSRRMIAWSNTVLHDESGEVEFMVSSGLDITERKRNEEELRASRARIVEAGDAERRRLERNLHDGAQQRLVALSLALRMAQAQVRANPEAAEEILAASTEELSAALDELRELARGIHPAVLTDRGLPAALEALAGRAPTPVDIRIGLDDRLPPTIEAAAYYVVSEALANVAKYASARSVTVSVERRNGVALVEVADDGVGGADPTLGSGLRGLADRVAALDGTLEVTSTAGRGTTVRAEIPVDGPA